MNSSWQGQQVLIIGAARQGLALARFFAARGAQVILNDRRAPEQLQAEQQALAGLPITWAMGGHPFDLLQGTNLVCVSGGVPLNLPILEEARQQGIALTNDSQIFLEAVQARVIGITGSAGKTTTTTLVGRMAQAQAQAAGKRAWVGGNIGQPLVEFVDEISADDLVVLELSSFQLELMTRSPQIAAILNITPNHLDRHGTLEAYSAAKARILAFQTVEDTAVLGRDDVGAWALRGIANGQLVSFGLRQLTGEESAGTYLQDGTIFWQAADGTPAEALLPLVQIRLRGEHNRGNVLAACAIAAAAGWSKQSIQLGVDGFGGVSHRLELIREWNGVAWYNDSIATAPERTIAALESFREPLVLLLGGRDKNLPWQRLAELAHRRVDHIVVFGEAAAIIRAALGDPRPDGRLATIDYCEDLYSAVQTAAQRAEPGDVVLLSPGGTSYDAFKDFEERGEQFTRWVNNLS